MFARDGIPQVPGFLAILRGREQPAEDIVPVARGRARRRLNGHELAAIVVRVMRGARGHRLGDPVAVGVVRVGGRTNLGVLVSVVRRVGGGDTVDDRARAITRRVIDVLLIPGREAYRNRST